ncbi:MAG: hypothetical protein ABSD28_19710, partial [Tepidisphaeraceae bacterium]
MTLRRRSSPSADNPQSSHHDRSCTRRFRHTGSWQRQSVGRGEGVQCRHVAGRRRAAHALVEVRRQEGEVLAVDRIVKIGYWYSLKLFRILRLVRRIALLPSPEPTENQNDDNYKQ